MTSKIKSRITDAELLAAQERSDNRQARDLERGGFVVIEKVFRGRGIQRDVIRAKVHAESGRVFYCNLNDLEVF